MSLISAGLYYHLREQNLTWVEIGKRCGVKTSTAMLRAKLYAKQQSLPWPLHVDSVARQPGVAILMVMSFRDDMLTHAEMRSVKDAEKAIRDIRMRRGPQNGTADWSIAVTPEDFWRLFRDRSSPEPSDEVG